MSAATAESRSRRRTPVSVLLSRVVLAAALVGLYAPIAMTFVYSFNASKRIGTVWQGFSLDPYRHVFEQEQLLRGLLASLFIGFQTSCVAVALGTLAAVGLSRWPGGSRRAGQVLLALPLVTPDIILGLSLALFFTTLHVDRGWGTVVLAHAVFGISYAYVVMAGAVRDLDENLYWAALDLGATPGQAFWRVTVPLLLPAMGVAWLLVFALSFDDFVITFLTKGPGADTLPIKIYGQMRFGVRPQTNALFVLLFIGTLGIAAVAARLGRRVDL